MSTPAPDDEAVDLAFLAGKAGREPATQEERWMQAAGQILRERERAIEADLDRLPPQLPQEWLTPAPVRRAWPMAGLALAAGLAGLAFGSLLLPLHRDGQLEGALRVTPVQPDILFKNAAGGEIVEYDVQTPDPAAWASKLAAVLIHARLRVNFEPDTPDNSIVLSFVVPAVPGPEVIEALRQAHVPPAPSHRVTLHISPAVGGGR